MIIEINEVLIPTWTEPETLQYCAQIARQSKFMVEVGVYFGASSRAMLKANSGLHLWSADTFGVFGAEQVTRLFLRDWIENGQCEIVVGDSVKAASILPHMEGRLDAVWIDDGHAEEDLRRDISSMLPLLRRGGILFGHDWDGDNDVARGVKSMLPVERMTFPCPRVWQYIKP